MPFDPATELLQLHYQKMIYIRTSTLAFFFFLVRVKKSVNDFNVLELSYNCTKDYYGVVRKNEGNPYV